MKGNILVVDDEANTRNSLAEFLRLEGYRVTVAADGEEALKYLTYPLASHTAGTNPASSQTDVFDVVLLDIIMPGVDGMQVLHEISKISPNTQVILLTAHGSLESAIDALRHGAHDYMKKPATLQEIVNSVQRAIAQREEIEHRRRLLEQIESSVQQLKDVDHIEPGESQAPSIVVLTDGTRIDLDRREIWQGERSAKLTPTEGKLLRILIENKSRVLTHRELVLMVHGYKTTDWEAPEILRPLVSRLRRKLATFDGGDQWISNVRGTGYVFNGV